MQVILVWLVNTLFTLLRSSVTLKQKVFNFLVKIKMPAKAAAFRPQVVKDLTKTRLEQIFNPRNWTFRDVVSVLLEGAGATWGLWTLGEWLMGDEHDEMERAIKDAAATPAEKQAMLNRLADLRNSSPPPSSTSASAWASEQDILDSVTKSNIRHRLSTEVISAESSMSIAELSQVNDVINEDVALLTRVLGTSTSKLFDVLESLKRASLNSDLYKAVL